MLVTSIFFFSHNVFKRLFPPVRQKSSLCGNSLKRGYNYVDNTVLVTCHFCIVSPLDCVQLVQVLTKFRVYNIDLYQPFPKQQILDSSKLREFADNNFKFDKDGQKFSKWVENTVRKGEIARDEQFLLFPQCFKKDLFFRNVKTSACLGKG